MNRGPGNAEPLASKTLEINIKAHRVTKLLQIRGKMFFAKGELATSQTTSAAIAFSGATPLGRSVTQSVCTRSQP